MNSALKVEFAKVKRRKIWLPVLCVLIVQLLWSLWALLRWRNGDFSMGWMYLLYQFPLFNCIMLPVMASMTASRLADVEHKGTTFRLLHTIQSPGSLFDAKFLCGSIYTLIAPLLQTTAILISGCVFYFGPIPWGQLGLFFLNGASVGLTLYLFQQCVSILVANQMIAMVLGLGGGLIGLMSMLFPASFQKYVLWAYFGVLSNVGMAWDQATRITTFNWQPFDWSAMLLLAAFFGVLYLIGRTLYIRKDQ